jgi:hypothetical protein
MMGVIRWKGGVNFPHSEFDRLPGDRAFGDLQGISHTDTGLLAQLRIRFEERSRDQSFTWLIRCLSIGHRDSVIFINDDDLFPIA